VVHGARYAPNPRVSGFVAGGSPDPPGPRCRAPSFGLGRGAGGL